MKTSNLEKLFALIRHSQLQARQAQYTDHFDNIDLIALSSGAISMSIASTVYVQ